LLMLIELVPEDALYFSVPLLFVGSIPAALIVHMFTPTRPCPQERTHWISSSNSICRRADRAIDRTVAKDKLILSNPPPHTGAVIDKLEPCLDEKISLIELVNSVNSLSP
jgi:hypothetical protein